MNKSNINYIVDNRKYLKKEFVEKYPKISNKLLDKTLENLQNESNFLIFPENFSISDDLDKDNKIIETVNDRVKFGNIIGFIGCGEENLEIHSRFSKEKDYFLHYMLEKVLNLNIVDLDTKISMNEKIYNLFIYLFPKYLNSAMRKGILKKYKNYKYNDMNIKGRIDIARHIKMNRPFQGKVTYSTREFTADNYLIQLIRHTIEFIKNYRQSGRNILNLSEITKQNIEKIIQETTTYNLGDRRKIINFNKTKPVLHAYYTEYRNLQKLCLMILDYRKHNIGGRDNNIYGILFDVAWLWEEYINTVLPENFIHAENRKNKNGISLYSDRQKTVYPDFYCGEGKQKENGIVLEAKYKLLEDTEENKKNIIREDLYQIIAYSYILKSKKAGVIYPSQEKESKYQKLGILNGYGAEIFKQSLKIPQENNSYKEFEKEITKIEEQVRENLKTEIEKLKEILK